MAVDTSMYNRTPYAPLNPLTTMSEAAGIRNALLNSKLLQQQQETGEQNIQGNQMELNAKNALMRAHAESMNSDGTQDTAKFNHLIANSPASLHGEDLLIQGNQLNAPTTYMGTDENGNPQQRMVSAQQMRAMLTPEQKQHIDTQHDRIDAIGNTLHTLLQKSDLSMKDVCSATGDLCASGHLTPQEGAVELANMPQSPDEIKGWLMGHYSTVLQTKQHLDMISPKQNQSMEDFQQEPESGQIQENDLPSVNQSNADNILPQPTAVHIAPKSPGVAAATPMGYNEKLTATRARIDQVHNDATAAPQNNAILDNIYNLSKSGAPTGTITAKIYKSLADKGLVDPTNNLVQQQQEIAKYMEQAVLANGMPGSDSRLESLHHANVNPDLLPGTIQKLLPFLRASNQAKILKQSYYNKATNGGLDPDKEIQAKQQWDENYDPRLIEFKALPNVEAKRDYLKDHPEIIDLLPKLRNLNKMGVFKQ